MRPLAVKAAGGVLTGAGLLVGGTVLAGLYAFAKLHDLITGEAER